MHALTLLKLGNSLLHWMCSMDVFQCKLQRLVYNYSSLCTPWICTWLLMNSSKNLNAVLLSIWLTHVSVWSFLPLAEPDCGWDRLLDLNLHSHTVSPCQILSASSRWRFFQFFTSTSSLQKLRVLETHHWIWVFFKKYIYIYTVSIKKQLQFDGGFLAVVFFSELKLVSSTFPNEGCLKKNIAAPSAILKYYQGSVTASTARLLWLDKNREPTLPATFDVTRFYPRPLKVEQTFSNEKHLSETFNLWVGF